MAKNRTVSPNQIPQVFRAYRPRFVQFLARLLLKIFGWKVDGIIPEMRENENLVLIAAPHTSNWDGIFGFAAITGLGKEKILDSNLNPPKVISCISLLSPD